MTVTLAWHGDPALKAEVAARMRKHREEDEIVQGLYQLVNKEWASGYKGCLIGCTLPPQPIPDHTSIHAYSVLGVEPVAPASGWHGRVEEVYGIVEPVGHLLDKIFENLPTEDGQHALFAVASIDTIPVGADLSMVASQLMLDVLTDPTYGVHQHAEEGTEQRAAIETVTALYARRLAGDEPTREEWLDAKETAETAGEDDYTAYADVANYAASAGYDQYPESYFPAVVNDTAEAYDTDKSYDAEPEWYGWAASRLLHHLANAPIPAKV